MGRGRGGAGPWAGRGPWRRGCGRGRGLPGAGQGGCGRGRGPWRGRGAAGGGAQRQVTRRREGAPPGGPRPQVGDGLPCARPALRALIARRSVSAAPVAALARSRSPLWVAVVAVVAVPLLPGPSCSRPCCPA